MAAAGAGGGGREQAELARSLDRLRSAVRAEAAPSRRRCRPAGRRGPSGAVRSARAALSWLMTLPGQALLDPSRETLACLARSASHPRAAAAALRTEMWPSSGRSHSSAERVWRASHRPCERGATRSWPVVRHPADAELRRGREQGLGRRANVRRAVMPEHRQLGVGTIRGGVVTVQRAPVAQLNISLRHHPPSLVTVAGAR
jgi:hypothetical protein